MPASRTMRHDMLIQLFACLLAAAACAGASDWDAIAIDEGSRRWVSVYRGADYRVYIDTANIQRRPDGMHEMWYRTDHRVPHVRHGRRWNREVSQSMLSCRRRLYKVISADLSLADRKPISQQRASGNELFHQPWRDVQAGSADEATMLAACSVVESSKPNRPLADAVREDDSPGAR